MREDDTKINFEPIVVDIQLIVELTIVLIMHYSECRDEVITTTRKDVEREVGRTEIEEL